MKTINNPADALLFCDYLAKFGNSGSEPNHFAGLASVIRELMRRLEEQAMAAEKAEAAK